MSQVRIAFDIQTNPPVVLRQAQVRYIHGVTLFYVALFLLLLGFGLTILQKKRIAADMTAAENRKMDVAMSLEQVDSEITLLRRRQAISNDVVDWLLVTPPTQGIFLLLSKDVEPEVSFTKLAFEAEPGSPNARLTIEFASGSSDASTRQVSKIQDNLSKAGFRTVSIESDGPAGEGWRFVSLIALPPNGEFQRIVQAVTKN